jgi:hypothetical protein
MKKITLPISLAVICLAGSFLTACMSDNQKKEAAQAQVDSAQANLDKVKVNAAIVEQKAATEEEFKTFKLESELKIKNNEVSIAALKLKMNKSGSTLDEVYARRIDSIEIKNKNLKTRVNDYERSHSDWTKFKQDFNRDMDDLGRSITKIVNSKSK